MPIPLGGSNPKNATHGRSKDAMYDIWCSMRQRCENPNHKYYHKYGGAGITVCKRWKRFEAFLADMGERPSPSHTLERKKNTQGYNHLNCVWATRKEQALNRRSVKWFTHEGETLCLKDWAQKLGINYHTLYGRIVFRNKPFKEAIRGNAKQRA